MTRCIQCGTEFEPSDIRNTLCRQEMRPGQEGPAGQAWTDPRGKELRVVRQEIRHVEDEYAKLQRGMRQGKEQHEVAQMARRRQEAGKWSWCGQTLTGSSWNQRLPISDDEAWRILLARSSSRKLKTRMERPTRKKMCTQCGKIFSTSAKMKPTCSAKCSRERKAAQGS